MRPRLPTAEKRSGNSAYPPSATETTAQSSMRRAFYETVACVPYGKVATYGQIATLAGYPGRARQVGFALAGMPGESDLPWHRIINAQGKVSPRSGSSHLVQYELLASEGVVFTAQRIDLKRFGWRPEAED